MILDPNLLRILQAQGPGFFKNSRPIDPELMQRRNFQLPVRQQYTPKPQYAPGGSPQEQANVDKRLEAMERQGRTMDPGTPAWENSPDPFASKPSQAPNKKSGYWNTLISDPKRMAFLRYGAGVLGGEKPGTAMDAGLKMYRGINAPGKAPTLVNIPMGDGKQMKGMWMGTNYQDAEVPGFPKGYKAIGKERNIWEPDKVENYQTTQNPFGLGGVGQTGPGGKIYNYQKPIQPKKPQDGELRKFNSNGKIITQQYDAENDDWYDFVESPQFNPRSGSRGRNPQAGMYRLPNGQYINHGQLMSEYKQANNLMDPLDIRFLQTEDPKRAAIEWDRLRNAMPFDQWAKSQFGIDVRGGFKPMTSAEAGEVPIPQTQDDFNALPSGTEYIDPDDGKRYRKP